jgi:glutamine amidotransferase
LIAIIDYGVGNLGSVEKALKFIGLKAVVTSDAGVIGRADGVVLPGVGAFSSAMASLESHGLVQAVKDIVRENRLFFGICLGMQMLFEHSEEGGGKVEGLSLFKGEVRALSGDMGLKVPHMGWNSLDISDCPLYKGLPDKPYVYFVHSFYLNAGDKSMVTATCDYGVTFDAAIGSGRVFATQFHPEKSGETGLTILKNWAGLI